MLTLKRKQKDPLESRRDTIVRCVTPQISCDSVAVTALINVCKSLAEGLDPTN